MSRLSISDKDHDSDLEMENFKVSFSESDISQTPDILMDIFGIFLPDFHKNVKIFYMHQAA